MKINEIQDLIKFVAKSGVNEVEIEDNGFKIVIKTQPKQRGGKSAEAAQPVVVHAPAQAAPPQPVAVPAATEAPKPAAAAETKASDDKSVAIKSPMIGTFYRRPSPDKPLFVNVGDEIKVGQTVCIIEAMKLFNEIESEVSGKVVKILVDDNTPVEYDQPLILVDPS